MLVNRASLEGQAIPIVTDTDIVEARRAARALATRVGFSGTDLTLIASAVSEIARNIIEYARPGEVVLSVIHNQRGRGVQVIARDQGPGIADLALAMTDGYSTSRSLGVGLPGSRRLMDEFRVESTVGHGTTITMRKWLS